jgi:hypothetical protein
LNKKELNMAELKTKPTDQSAADFLSNLADENQRRDAFIIMDLMRTASQAEPKMWGSSIIGFGDMHYKYASGREGDWFLVGFSPRKKDLTLYFVQGFKQYGDLLAKLGKFKTGKGCLYIHRLGDIDLPTLKALIEKSVEQMKSAKS